MRNYTVLASSTVSLGILLFDFVWGAIKSSSLLPGTVEACDVPSRFPIPGRPSRLCGPVRRLPPALLSYRNV